MLSRTCRSNLVGEVVHRKLSYVNLAANVSETVYAVMLSRTAYGKGNGNLSPTFFAIWDLEVRFGQKWIGRGGPFRWSARSPDLSCLSFFLWRHMKTLVYDTPVDNAEVLVARIALSAGKIRDLHGMFQKTRKSMRLTCEACIEVGGRNFEQYL
ncbi:hypothetical protein AVEN_141044-1 [Araneus ventricosus]|uniref:Uncharacterized protein n=1 Tax=Araneus ventricosus TaxID=182803 RepID=A0A4Y2TT03_ARAVE|nr:hypothetical protein AVEN_141044-1 [Araneus ventricosus]